jgi:hypothetical protein
MMNHIVQMSGGLSSAEGAVRVKARAGDDPVRLVFCDTLVEDRDLYRFLIQSSAYVFGVAHDAVRSLADRAAALPVVHEDTIEVRKSLLADLRRDATKAVPGLVWLAEGRTPWEVIFDSRFLSNRSDKCSEFLKRRLADCWCEDNCDPAQTIRYIGFGHNEQDRIERSRPRFEKAGWRVEFPMESPPYMVKVTLMQAWLDRGIQPPRLYYQGFPHNNCGGFCFKWGQASAGRLLSNDPAYFGFNERQEDAFRSTICADASSLKDRRGGGPRRPISLDAGCGFDYADRGSCSCFAEVAPVEET